MGYLCLFLLRQEIGWEEHLNFVVGWDVKPRLSESVVGVCCSSWMSWLIPLIVATAATFAYKYFIVGSTATTDSSH